MLNLTSPYYFVFIAGLGFFVKYLGLDLHRLLISLPTNLEQSCYVYDVFKEIKCLATGAIRTKEFILDSLRHSITFKPELNIHTDMDLK